jgi:hypothetical protein
MDIRHEIFLALFETHEDARFTKAGDAVNQEGHAEQRLSTPRSAT